MKQRCVKNLLWRDFPGGPVVKTSPSIAEGTGSIPGRGAKMPQTSRPKKKKENPRKQKHIVTNSIKTLKNLLKKKNLLWGQSASGLILEWKEKDCATHQKTFPANRVWSKVAWQRGTEETMGSRESRLNGCEKSMLVSFIRSLSHRAGYRPVTETLQSPGFLRGHQSWNKQKYQGPKV